ncbi:MAG: sigma-54-dependent Fis family transcriptional regulator [Opitutales bacterium]|nr:sigma-54-dependent Fis family transcriptional regulator [Opitutales bacterium]
MRILILDDCPNIRKITTTALKGLGHDCLALGGSDAALKEAARHHYDVILLDLHLGDDESGGIKLIPALLEADHNIGIVVITAYSSIASAVEAIQAGAMDYLPKPFTPELLEQCLGKVESNLRLKGRVRELESELQSRNPEATYSSQDPRMQAVFELALRAAATPTTLLILGESGTGKTMLARAIHGHSREKDGPFVTVNCPSLSKELFESDLFGHARGSFTGAVRDKRGKIAHAEGGTLFLDEIGDLPPEIQPKLLRLIQEREYERVGDPEVRRANVRVIAATNKNLEEEVREGRFREDLFYRLNVVPLEVPALRDRSADLPALARKQLDFLARQMGRSVRGFADDAMQAMRRYGWPGNLRELRNAIEHALIMAPGGEIRLDHLPAYLRDNNSGSCQVGAMITLEALERAHIDRILEVASSQEEAASILGIDPTTLYRKRKRYGRGKTDSTCRTPAERAGPTL